MKVKLLISALLLTAFSFQAWAQTDDLTERVALGVKAGINISNVYDTQGDGFDSKAKVGFAAGGFLSIPFGKFLGFQPELMYSQKGYKGSGSALLFSYSYTRKLDYIDIPLQLQIKPIPELTILVGPQYSFLIHKAIDFNAGGLSGSQQSDVENNNIRKNILGIVGGLDVHVMNFLLSGRLAWDLQNNNGDGTSSSPRYKNMVAQITVGVMF
jgi:hypothetical protein